VRRVNHTAPVRIRSAIFAALHIETA